MFLRTLIALASMGWDGQPFKFAANQFLKLSFPTVSRLGDEEQEEAVPFLTEIAVCDSLHISGECQMRI
jgi:hypothetical protein